jgi:hypothetical protein
MEFHNSGFDAFRCFTPSDGFWMRISPVGCTNSIFLQSAGFHVAGEISVARVGSSRITERLIVAIT